MLKYSLPLTEESKPVDEWELEDKGDDDVLISCISVADDLIFVGTTAGTVVILESAMNSDTINFRHQVPALFKPVTAIHASPGTVEGNEGCCLVIGGGAGEVKQFEILR